MLQRQSSVSSRRSVSIRSSSRNRIRRSASSSSMSTRTFREASPRRPSSALGRVNNDDVPALPSMSPEFATAREKALNRRSTSLDTPRRTASLPAKRPSARSVSVDRHRHPAGSPNCLSLSAHRLSTVHEVDRNSVNFSYPMKAPQNPQTNQSPVQFENNGTSEEPSSVAREPSSMEAPKIRRTASYAGYMPVRQRSRVFSPGAAERRQATSSHPTGTALAAAQAASLHDGSSAQGLDYEPSDTIAVDGRNVETFHRQPSSRRIPKRRPSALRKETNQGEEPAKAEAAMNHADQTHHIRPPSRASNHRFLRYDEQDGGARSPALDKADGQLAYEASTSSEVHPSTELSTATMEAHARQSRSPGRSAHFSSQLAVTGPVDHLHKPPPRSMSPVKSALKHSAKGSFPTDARAGIIVRPVQSPSEMSDGTSVASDDCLRPGLKKRRVKVSFDDEAEIVGVAASPPTSPEELAPDSAPEKTHSKTHWYTVGKRKRLQSENFSDEEFDEVLKPRPELPSFGSIRGIRDLERRQGIRGYPSDSESLSSLSSSPDVTGLPFSHDHALGGLVTKILREDPTEHTEVGHPYEPALSNDSSVETSNQATHSYHNATVDESSLLASSVDNPPLANASREEEEIVTASASGDPGADTTQPTPTDGIQPVSEDLEKDRKRNRCSLELYRVPGDFPSSPLDYDLRAAGGVQKPDQQFDRSPKESDPPKKSGAENNQESSEESSDNVYSDAPEHLPDDDGGGFGSINAIVDTRKQPSGMALHVDTELASESAMTANTSKPEGRSGYEISSARVRSARSPAVWDSNQRARGRVPVKGLAAERAVHSPGYFNDEYLSSPSRRSPIESRGHAENAGFGTLGRTESVRTAKQPMYIDTYRDYRQHNARRIADGPDRTLPKRSANASSSLRQGVATERKIKRKVLPPSDRQDIDTSDSHDVREYYGRDNHSQSASLSNPVRGAMPNVNDSSGNFNRSRVSPTGHGNFGMRRTMRGDADGSRPLSPTHGLATPGDREPTSGPTGSSTMRSTNGAGSKPSVFSGNGKTSKTKAAKSSGHHFLSRFDDSDDEGTSKGARNFRSRFDDSSDDSGPVHSRPVRGIPRRKGTRDGDSTELEDSSGDERPPPWETPEDSALAAVARSRGMTTEQLEEFLNQPAKGPKIGFFRRLHRKKSKRIDEKARRPDPDNTATLDTHLEHSRPERDNHRTPRLQRSDGDAWSRSNRHEGNDNNNDNNERPQTADGVAAVNGNGYSGAALDVVIAPRSTPRKKRFPLLRKAFGLRL